jgi:hypothetical protein
MTVMPEHQNPPAEVDPAPAREDAIRAIVVRLSRPHPRGDVIERAAILAEGASSTAIMDWIVAHAGEPEAAPAPAASRGLHSSRIATAPTAVRYVLPAGSFV